MRRLLLLALLFAAPALAQDKKISDLPDGSPGQATDAIPIARAGANYRLPFSAFAPAWTGGAFTAPLLGPAADNCATPPFSFTGETTTGLCSSASGTLNLRVAGVNQFALTATAITSTVPVLLPAGTASVPALGFSADADGSQPGLYRAAADTLSIGTGATESFRFDPGNASIIGYSGANPVASFGIYGLNLIMGRAITWTGSTTNHAAARDLYLDRDAANTLQQGQDAATAAAQTFKGPDSTGSGTTGGSFTLKGGAGTSGNAAGGALILSGGAQAGSGEPGAVTIADGGTKPTCAAGIRGAIWYDAGGAGVADTFEVCRKDAANAYAWVTLY